MLLLSRAAIRYFHIENMKILALIPARSGSKRLLNKNILSFAGKPLIAWSIDAALKCGLFADVVVSTDSPEIAAIAKQYHAQVPFLRPSNLSDDFPSSYLVAEHALTSSGLCLLQR